MSVSGLLSKRSYAARARKFRAALPLSLAGVLVAPVGAGAAAGASADLVLRGGAIYTVDAARSWASALAVRDRRLVYVGSEAGAEAFVGPGTRVVDLQGRFVLPGFHDRHVHPVTGGVELAQCDLNGSADAAELLARIRACAERDPAKPWILGGGWDLTLFPGGVADRRTLDAVVADRPVFLGSADGHSSWANSRALAIAGIGRETPDPPKGRIERDAAGEPIGTLREAAAHLVDPFLPGERAVDRETGLALALERAAAFGLVALTEANATPEIVAAYDALDARGAGLPVRAVVSQSLSSRRGLAAIPELVALRSAPHGPRVKATAVKLFADGVIEGGTAALLAPYVGRPGAGIPNWSAAELRDVVVALDREKFQIHVHAIGDRAIRETLDALEAARAANGVRDARPLLAHLQLFDPADLPRLRRLGAVADFQPLWAYADAYIRDLTQPFLGPDRSRWLYPIGSVARTGAALAAGSDWSVSSMNPLLAMEVAVTRCDSALATCDRPWIPEERVDLATIVAAYTIGGAYAGFEERDSGSLEAGKLADLVVLDRNLFEIPPGTISEAKVLVTLFEGRETFGSLAALRATEPAAGNSTKEER